MTLIATPAETAHGQQPMRFSSTTVVSRFTTYFESGQPRVINIRRAARLLDRQVILPGQVFSMNAALGRRTRARGFVPAPMISGGVLVDSVGGGISQVATSLYNAAFFAGLRLIAHTLSNGTRSYYLLGRTGTHLREQLAITTSDATANDADIDHRDVLFKPSRATRLDTHRTPTPLCVGASRNSLRPRPHPCAGTTRRHSVRRRARLQRQLLPSCLSI
jgi:VanW like protein